MLTHDSVGVRKEWSGSNTNTITQRDTFEYLKSHSHASEKNSPVTSPRQVVSPKANDKSASFDSLDKFYDEFEQSSQEQERKPDLGEEDQISRTLSSNPNSTTKMSPVNVNINDEVDNESWEDIQKDTNEKTEREH